MQTLIDIEKLTGLDSGVFKDAPFDICSYCSTKIPRHQVTKDHIIPRSRGGSGASNYAPSCYDCNQRKANLDLLTFLLLRPASSRDAQKTRRRRREDPRHVNRQPLTYPLLDPTQMAILRLFRAGATNLVISSETKEKLSRM